MLKKKLGKKALAFASAAVMAVSATATGLTALSMTAFAGEELGEGTFENGKGLPWHICENATAVMKFDITDGIYAIKLENIGGTANGGESRWDCQFRHRNLTIESGHTYRITYSVNPSNSGHMYPKLGNMSKDDQELWHSNGDELSLSYEEGLTQEQLEHTLMPVGNYSKDQIREMAEKIGLQVANKPDSQDICFVPDGDYASFIEENADAPIRQGNFVTPDGKILGKHKGIIHYTVGQRKGLGLALGYPAFVLEIRPETDEVVIGTYEESLTHTLRANELNFMSVEDLTEPMRVFAKIRYNHKGAWCTVEKTGEDEITCTFDEPIRAVTPGQAVVLYDGEYVLGGGTIL